MIEVRAIPDASERESMAWSLDAQGEVRLTTTRCAACRWPDPRHRTFSIPLHQAARLLARLPEAEIEAALQASCTLPSAKSGWARQIDLNYRFAGGGGVFTGFFGNCRSPLLDRMAVVLREIGETLIELEPEAAAEP